MTSCVRQQQVHQERSCRFVEAETVDQSVREDITAHSTFIQYHRRSRSEETPEG